MLQIVVPGTRQTCKQGEQGEICTKGPGLTIGYLNKPAETKALFDDDGWLHTGSFVYFSLLYLWISLIIKNRINYKGDIGYLDEFGSLYIVDRLTELIKVNYANQTLMVITSDMILTDQYCLHTRSFRSLAMIFNRSLSGCSCRARGRSPLPSRNS